MSPSCPWERIHPIYPPTNGELLWAASLLIQLSSCIYFCWFLTECKLCGVRTDLRRKKNIKVKTILWPSVNHKCDLFFLTMLLRGAEGVSGHGCNACAVWKMVYNFKRLHWVSCRSRRKWRNLTWLPLGWWGCRISPLTIFEDFLESTLIFSKRRASGKQEMDSLFCQCSLLML